MIADELLLTRLWRNDRESYKVGTQDLGEALRATPGQEMEEGEFWEEAGEKQDARRIDGLDRTIHAMDANLTAFVSTTANSPPGSTLVRATGPRL